jgi:histidinol-phosphate aminotransferase
MKINPHVQASGLWEAKDRDLSKVTLNLNENRFMDNFLSSFLTRHLEAKALHSYPNYGELVDALAAHCGTAAANVLLTNGADQAIDLAMRLLFAPGDTVVIPSPIFSFYYQMAQVNGVRVEPVYYTKGPEGFVFPLERTLAALDGANGLVLCNPNNPLGASIDDAQLRQMIGRCVERDIPVVVDEAYYEFLGKTCYAGADTPAQVVVIRSFSKYFGLAGLRLGYVLAASFVVRELMKIRGPWDVNHVAVNAALHCLRNGAALRERQAAFAEAKAALMNACAQAGFQVYASDCNFILVEDHLGGLLAALRDADILVSDCANYPYSDGITERLLRIAMPSNREIDWVCSAIVRHAQQRPRGMAA